MTGRSTEVRKLHRPLRLRHLRKVFRPLGIGGVGFNRRQIQQKYFEVFGRYLGGVKAARQRDYPCSYAGRGTTSEQDPKTVAVDFLLDK